MTEKLYLIPGMEIQPDEDEMFPENHPTMRAKFLICSLGSKDSLTLVAACASHEEASWQAMQHFKKWIV